MKLVFIALSIVSAGAYGDSCLELGRSDDGTPAEYNQKKCLADRYLSDNEYEQAAKYYEEASSVTFFEAPNYDLRLEWGYSLCLAGQDMKGSKKIESFELMAKADLGQFDCPSDIEKLRSVIQKEHMELACVGYGSELTEEGRMNLKNRLDLAKKYKKACNNA